MTILTTPTLSASLSTKLRTSIAAASGSSTASVSITRLTAGSVIVDYQVSGVAATEVATVQTNLQGITVAQLDSVRTFFVANGGTISAFAVSSSTVSTGGSGSTPAPNGGSGGSTDDDMKVAGEDTGRSGLMMAVCLGGVALVVVVVIGVVACSAKDQETPMSQRRLKSSSAGADGALLNGPTTGGGGPPLARGAHNPPAPGRVELDNL